MVNMKDKILNAALKQFLAHGKKGATTKAIAESAGANKAMIHYYYTSKDKLFTACVKEILEQMEQTFHTVEVRSIDDYKTYIESLIKSYTIFITTHNKNIIFLLWEYLNDETLLNDIKNIMGSAHLVDFIEKTKKAIDKGVIKNIEPLSLYLNLFSLILSTYTVLPIALSFLDEESEENKKIIMEKRQKEISRLLWDDIKGVNE